MSVYRDMASDAGYHGDEAEQVACQLECDHRQEVEAALEHEELEREFHRHEMREMNDCQVYNWLMGFDPAWGSEMYLLGPMDVVAWNWREALCHS